MEYIDFCWWKSPTIKTEYKIFLMKFFKTYDKYKKSELSHKELAEELGVTKTIVARATEYFVSCGYLIKGDAFSRHRRAISSYQCTQKLIYVLRKNIPLTFEMMHEELIEHLLEPDVSYKKRITAHPLNLSNRLLLIILLSHADSCGAVRNLGRENLSQLTGSSHDSLRKQLKKLKVLGYIRTYSSGVSNSKILGVLNGEYILNIEHKNFNKFVFRPDKSISTTFIYQTKLITAQNRVTDAYSLISLLRSLNEQRSKYHKRLTKSISDDCNQARAIESFFDLTVMYSPLCLVTRNLRIEYRNVCEKILGAATLCVPTYLSINNISCLLSVSAAEYQSIAPLLQGKLEGYASYLLSAHWVDISTSEDFLSAHLLAKIKNELLPRLLLKENESTVDEVTRFFHCVSWAIAKKYQALLIKMMEYSLTPLNMDEVDIIIIPFNGATGSYRSHVVIKVFRKSFRIKKCQFSKGTHMFEGEEGKDGDRYCSTSYDVAQFGTLNYQGKVELTDEEMFKFGLLTQ